MSIWNTLYIGSSGITSFGKGMQVVGDNIANVNTAGFKAGRARFEAMLGGSSLNGQRIGNGVRMTGAQVLFGGGAIQQTERSLDLALDGAGFFAVRDIHSGLTTYTRDGRFSMDGEGYLVAATGRVQAYGVEADGSVSTVPGDLRFDVQSPGRAAARIDMNVQLDSDAETPGSTFSVDDPTSYNYATQVEIADSRGASHQVTVFFRTNGDGTWDWTAAVDGTEIDEAPGLQEIGGGTVEFDTSGRLVDQSGGFSANFVNAEPGQTVEISFGNPLNATGGDGSGSTSYDNPSSVTSVASDGAVASALQDVRVDEQGLIVALYQNGQERTVGAMAVAQIPVEDGLARSANQGFLATVRSGQPVLGRATEGLRGKIVGSAIESSNVDLSNELVTMIAYQRAFQSNARTISTADEMLQELTNLKR